MRWKHHAKAALILIVFALLATAAEAKGITVYGFVLNDCGAGASLNITLYNSTGHLNQTQPFTAGNDGGYGVYFEPPNDQLYDVNVTAENPGCSPSARGTMMAYGVSSGGAMEMPTEIEVNITLNADFAGIAPGNNTYAGNETQFNWTNDYLGVDNFTIIISTDPTFTTVDRTITSITGLGYQLTNAEELPDDVYYWKTLAHNTTGANIDNTTLMRFEVATGAAIIINETPANSTWTRSTTQAVLLQTQLDAECKYSTNPGTAYDTMIPFTSTGATNHSGTIPLGTEGTNTFYIKCNTTAGVINVIDQEYSLNRDTTPPDPSGANIIIDGGATYSLDTTIDFNWAGFSDGTGSGVDSYYYSFSDNGGTTIGTNDASSPGQLAGASQGAVNVYVWAVDAAGNIGAAAHDDIIVDTLPPSFQSWGETPADLNKYYTGNFRVDVTFEEVSGINGTPTLRYRIGEDEWSEWQDLIFMSIVGYARNYYAIIEEQASPNTWFEREGENLTYQVRVADIHNRTNNITRHELIDDQAMPPILDPIADIDSIEDDLTIFNLTAYDQDQNTLTYTCNLSGAVITKTNDTFATVRWTPTNDDVGVYTAACNVTDGTWTDSELFTVTVTNVNDEPVLGSIGDLYAQEYVFFNYTINATDVDGDVLSFTTNATIFSLNRLTGKIGFTPSFQQRGAYAVNISVSDGNGGFDYESILFTVGYCGDGTCRSGHENCSVCEPDCGICGEGESKAIMVEPRNCLDEEMTIRAVSLVERATCEVKGTIIDGMEVCGNESDTTLIVSLLIDREEDKWEEVSTLVADQDGYATYTPTEAGEYKVAYRTDSNTYTLFEVKQCVSGEEADESSKDGSKPSRPDEPLRPPIVEEPATVDELESRWTFFSIFLYFFVIPLLLLALIITSLGYVYRLERGKEKKTSFVKQMDRWSKEYADLKRKVSSWTRKTSPFKEFLLWWSKARQELVRAWALVKGVLVEYWFRLVVLLGMRRQVRLEYFKVDAQGKTMHLLLISLLKNLFPKRSVDELLGLIYEYSVKTLLDAAAMLMSFGVQVTYVDPQPENVNYLNALLAKGLRFRSHAPSRVDVESSLQDGRPVVCVVNELGDKNTVVQSMVIVFAFDKEHFYYHDYIHGRQGLRATKDQFMHAWKAAGHKGLWMKR
ncbi:hypothetical protein JXA12_03255 [Candidatus Woesearchaeota archaeon]|nr:hypothetical protein [Candidatus Woesearchaeota archaeon]